MTFTPNPRDVELAAEERRDLEQAEYRGRRLLLATDEVIDALIGGGLNVPRQSARPIVFHVLADTFYPGRAIDIPDL